MSWTHLGTLRCWLVFEEKIARALPRLSCYVYIKKLKNIQCWLLDVLRINVFCLEIFCESFNIASKIAVLFKLRTV
jgi:hypothetical protein